MRKPDTVEHLYLDFDGFFASVEQQADPALRGRPVGVVPMQGVFGNTTMIACSREAKARGVKNVMRTAEARELCPDLVLVSQKPDLYRRAHNHLLSEITAVLPVDSVKSIDELTCRLDRKAIADPLGTAQAIKVRIRREVGPHITCSIGIAANRLLAKIACKVNKPDGVTLWRPEDMPGPLLARDLDEVPGVGRSMQVRLHQANIVTMADLLAVQPKQMRALWHNVTGERMWYALHGYDIQASPSGRSMYGHGRVLPPSHRRLPEAELCSRLLLVKAARRMRRDQRAAGRLSLWIALREGGWSDSVPLHHAQDDRTCLDALEQLWARARGRLGPVRAFRVGVFLSELVKLSERQIDWLAHDVARLEKRERIQAAIDRINTRYAASVVSHGLWTPPPGGYAGGKIAFTRIPKAEDFW